MLASMRELVSTMAPCNGEEGVVASLQGVLKMEQITPWGTVRASTIVEWTSLRLDLWPQADLITWCMHVGGATLANAVSILVASTRAPLVRRAADMIGSGGPPRRHNPDGSSCIRAERSL